MHQRYLLRLETKRVQAGGLPCVSVVKETNKSRVPMVSRNSHANAQIRICKYWGSLRCGAAVSGLVCGRDDHTTSKPPLICKSYGMQGTHEMTKSANFYRAWVCLITEVQRQPVS